MTKATTDWHYTTQGNGAFVTIYSPDGRTAFLQGDDAARFMSRAQQTTRADVSLCREYEHLMVDRWADTEHLDLDRDSPERLIEQGRCDGKAGRPPLTLADTGPGGWLGYAYAYSAAKGDTTS